MDSPPYTLGGLSHLPSHSGMQNQVHQTIPDGSDRYGAFAGFAGFDSSTSASLVSDSARDNSPISTSGPSTPVVLEEKPSWTIPCPDLCWADEDLLPWYTGELGPDVIKSEPAPDLPSDYSQYPIKKEALGDHYHVNYWATSELNHTFVHLRANFMSVDSVPPPESLLGTELVDTLSTQRYVSSSPATLTSGKLPSYLEFGHVAQAEFGTSLHHDTCQPSRNETSDQDKVASSRTRQARTRSSSSSPVDVVRRAMCKCDYPGCNKAFRRNEHLKRHKQTFHGEGPNRFSCEFCGKDQFNRKDNLNSHRKLHARPNSRNRGVEFIPAAVHIIEQEEGSRKRRAPFHSKAGRKRC
ncbi:zinc finger odd-paired-like (opl) [Fusarium albosuccineum]|uniref:Zinc finger odd-paired-like (Opl) n=1 Tax=Fusarium albosuccineum TaxID=1237068 RepID=A0A8H4PGL0_9HYPO|nr:zinc finger odd-paired-like (opl) [Fusarium albosuccineum]